MKKEVKKLEIYQDTDNDFMVMIDGVDAYSGVSQDHVLEMVSEFLERVTPYK